MGDKGLAILDGRRFRGVENYDGGDLDASTRFFYHQQGRAVWGTMHGDRIAHGGLVARLNDDSTLSMRWHYITPDGDVMSGDCRSRIESVADGRLRLHETWRIDGSGETGMSVIEEIEGSAG